MNSIINALTIVVLLVCTACASNALTIESASNVSKAADKAVAESKSSLEVSRGQRQTAISMFIASNPSCAPRSRLTAYIPKDVDTDHPLCQRPGDDDLEKFYVFPVELTSISDAQLKPIILLMAAVSEYGGALAKIAERPGADVTKELEAVIEKATEASGLVDGLLGTSLSDSLNDAAKELASDQGKSALALIQFASDLLSERKQVDDIRDYVAKNSDALSGNIKVIKSTIEQWSAVYTQGDAQVIANSLFSAYRSEAKGLAFAERVEFVKRALIAREQVADVEKTTQKLLKAWDNLSNAQATLLRHLSGEFTDEESEKIAAENQKRILQALGLIANAVGSFGGL